LRHRKGLELPLVINGLDRTQKSLLLPQYSFIQDMR
jgi:hypothetical protein